MLVSPEEPMPVPTTSVYSKSDGVVHWSSCLDYEGAKTENIEIIGSHSGMAHNPLVFHSRQTTGSAFAEGAMAYAASSLAPPHSGFSPEPPPTLLPTPPWPWPAYGCQAHQCHHRWLRESV
jgi:hypothetical protein